MVGSRQELNICNCAGTWPKAHAGIIDATTLHLEPLADGLLWLEDDTPAVIENQAKTIGDSAANAGFIAN